MTHYLTNADLKKSELHEELSRKLAEISNEYYQVYEDYTDGKATEDQVIQTRKKLDTAHNEWRNTFVTLKNEE